jgi:hypothetical protein
MRRAARIDNTAKDLVKAAKQLGFRHHHLGGVLDCLLMDKRGRVHLVEWKSPGGTLTPDQVKLVAAGWPVRFVQDVHQLQQLLGGTE